MTAAAAAWGMGGGRRGGGRYGGQVNMESGRISSLYYPKCDPTKVDMGAVIGAPFTVCLFKSASDSGWRTRPRLGDAVAGGSINYVSSGTTAVVDFDSDSDFGALFGSPTRLLLQSNYAWAIFGALVIETAGDYKLCITSDDG